jgi:hypothetical protein
VFSGTTDGLTATVGAGVVLAAGLRSGLPCLSVCAPFTPTCWTPATPGFILQERTNLTLGAWGNSPRGATNPVTVPVTLPTKFYRLFQP